MRCHQILTVVARSSLWNSGATRRLNGRREAVWRGLIEIVAQQDVCILRTSVLRQPQCQETRQYRRAPWFENYEWIPVSTINKHFSHKEQVASWMPVGWKQFLLPQGWATSRHWRMSYLPRLMWPWQGTLSLVPIKTVILFGIRFNTFWNKIRDHFIRRGGQPHLFSV